MSEAATPRDHPRSWRAIRRRMAWILSLMGLALVGFYFWQPLRVDFQQRRPEAPLPRVDLEQIGLWEPRARVVVVTAHPDDEAFYLGGTLATLQDSKAVVKLVVLTNGDKGYYPFNNSRELAVIRQRETREAARKVGIRDVQFLNYPDGRLRAESEAVDNVRQAIRAFQATFVLAFDPDFPPRISHGDHRVAGEITARSLEGSSFSGWVLYYSTFGANAATDISDRWPAVVDLLGIHASQFNGEKLRAIEAMVMESAQAAGAKFGVELAEPFRAVEIRAGSPNVPGAAGP